MSDYFDDIRKKFLREGKSEEWSEDWIRGYIGAKIESVINLMERAGFTFEEAVDTITNEYNREIVIEGVKRKLSG